jgi:hypothetical protein
MKGFRVTSLDLPKPVIGWGSSGQHDLAVRECPRCGHTGSPGEFAGILHWYQEDAPWPYGPWEYTCAKDDCVSKLDVDLDEELP